MGLEYSRTAQVVADLRVEEGGDEAATALGNDLLELFDVDDLGRVGEDLRVREHVEAEAHMHPDGLLHHVAHHVRHLDAVARRRLVEPKD